MTILDSEAHFFENDNWPYVGVYLYPESSQEMFNRLEFAFKHGCPVYVRYSDWNGKARDAHQALIFASNVGFVTLVANRVNGKPIPDWLIGIKLSEYFEYRNMDRYDMWSKFTSGYYDPLVSAGKVDLKKVKRDFDYDFPDINHMIDWQVKEL